MDIAVLLWSAMTIAIVHTLAGPDHYLPFVMIGKARNWKLSRVVTLTAICGVAHVLSSVLLGFLGIQLGVFVENLIGIESVRGEWAAWSLIAFGLIYGTWGLKKVFEQKQTDSHIHTHHNSKNVTPWILFTIFVLGPCEPLIPVLMYPAMEHGIVSAMLVALIFGFFTIAIMMITVVIMFKGVQHIKFYFIEKYSHAIAGYTIFISGSAVKFLGL